MAERFRENQEIGTRNRSIAQVGSQRPTSKFWRMHSNLRRTKDEWEADIFFAEAAPSPTPKSHWRRRSQVVFVSRPTTVAEHPVLSFLPLNSPSLAYSQQILSDSGCVRGMRIRCRRCVRCVQLYGPAACVACRTAVCVACGAAARCLWSPGPLSVWPPRASPPTCPHSLPLYPPPSSLSRSPFPRLPPPHPPRPGGGRCAGRCDNWRRRLGCGCAGRRGCR